jgi:uncharacterized protein (DUF2062 family)
VSVCGPWHFVFLGHDTKGSSVIGRFELRVRKFITFLLKEKLDPRRAAAAVFLGIFIGIVPIYGFHALAAVGVALLFRLNKPLTLAGTFISNPLLQPLIVFSSVELGCLLYRGSFQPLTFSALAAASTHLTKEQILIWIIGSVALGILLGGLGAAVTAVVVHLHRKASANSELGERVAL